MVKNNQSGLENLLWLILDSKVVVSIGNSKENLFKICQKNNIDFYQIHNDFSKGKWTRENTFG